MDEGMSIHRKIIEVPIETIECDGSGCYVEISEDRNQPGKTVSRLAFDAGWKHEYPHHFCPSCAAKKSEG